MLQGAVLFVGDDLILIRILGIVGNDQQLADNPTFHVRNESQRFARAFVRFLELSNKGLHYTPADAVCAASELTFGGGCAGSVSPSWFKRILTSSFGST